MADTSSSASSPSKPINYGLLKGLWGTDKDSTDLLAINSQHTKDGIVVPIVGQYQSEVISSKISSPGRRLFGRCYTLVVPLAILLLLFIQGRIHAVKSLKPVNTLVIEAEYCDVSLSCGPEEVSTLRFYWKQSLLMDLWSDLLNRNYHVTTAGDSTLVKVTGVGGARNCVKFFCIPDFLKNTGSELNISLKHASINFGDSGYYAVAPKTRITGPSHDPARVQIRQRYFPNGLYINTTSAVVILEDVGVPLSEASNNTMANTTIVHNAFGPVLIRDSSSATDPKPLVLVEESLPMCSNYNCSSLPISVQLSNTTQSQSFFSCRSSAPDQTPSATTIVVTNATSVYLRSFKPDSGGDLAGDESPGKDIAANDYGAPVRTETPEFFSQTPQFSPPITLELEETHNFLRGKQWRSYIQGIEIMSPALGVLYLESNVPTYLRFNPAAIEWLTAEVLTPNQRRLVTPLSHYQCNQNITTLLVPQPSLSSTVEALADVNQFEQLQTGYLSFELLREVWIKIQKLVPTNQSAPGSDSTASSSGAQHLIALTMPLYSFQGTPLRTFQVSHGVWSLVDISDSAQTSIAIIMLSGVLAGFIVLGIYWVLFYGAREKIKPWILMYPQRNALRSLIHDPPQCNYGPHYSFLWILHWFAYRFWRQCDFLFFKLSVSHWRLHWFILDHFSRAEKDKDEPKAQWVPIHFLIEEFNFLLRTNHIVPPTLDETEVAAMLKDGGYQVELRKMLLEKQLMGDKTQLEDLNCVEQGGPDDFVDIKKELVDDASRRKWKVQEFKSVKLVCDKLIFNFSEKDGYLRKRDSILRMEGLYTTGPIYTYFLREFPPTSAEKRTTQQKLWTGLINCIKFVGVFRHLSTVVILMWLPPALVTIIQLLYAALLSRYNMEINTGSLRNPSPMFQSVWAWKSFPNRSGHTELQMISMIVVILYVALVTVSTFLSLPGINSRGFNRIQVYLVLMCSLIALTLLAIALWYLLMIGLWWILGAIIAPHRMLAFTSSVITLVTGIYMVISGARAQRRKAKSELDTLLLEGMSDLLLRAGLDKKGQITTKRLLKASEGDTRALSTLSRDLNLPPSTLQLLMVTIHHDSNQLRPTVKEFFEECRIPVQLTDIAVCLIRKELGLTVAPRKLIDAIIELLSGIPNTQTLQQGLQKHEDVAVDLLAVLMSSSSKDQKERSMIEMLEELFLDLLVKQLKRTLPVPISHSSLIQVLHCYKICHSSTTNISGGGSDGSGNNPSILLLLKHLRTIMVRLDASSLAGSVHSFISRTTKSGEEQFLQILSSMVTQYYKPIILAPNTLGSDASKQEEVGEQKEAALNGEQSPPIQRKRGSCSLKAVLALNEFNPNLEQSAAVSEEKEKLQQSDASADAQEPLKAMGSVALIEEGLRVANMSDDFFKFLRSSLEAQLLQGDSDGNNNNNGG